MKILGNISLFINFFPSMYFRFLLYAPFSFLPQQLEQVSWYKKPCQRKKKPWVMQPLGLSVNTSTALERNHNEWNWVHCRASCPQGKKKKVEILLSGVFLLHEITALKWSNIMMSVAFVCSCYGNILAEGAYITYCCYCSMFRAHKWA